MTLTSDQKAGFDKDGYLIFESFFDGNEIAVLKTAIDEMLIIRSNEPEFQVNPPIRFMFEHPALAGLVRNAKVMSVVEEIMGPSFGFHHLHIARHEAGTPGALWHQDYEQFPQSNRSHAMVHWFYYLNGLNGEVGDLLLVPGTQRSVVDRGALSIFGESDLPGSVVVNDVPPGTAVLVHSALWHARRAKPGGEDRARYFADASYCQAGVQWPGYPNYPAFYDRAQAWGLTEGERGHLFNRDMFYDGSAAHRVQNSIPGSMILRTPDWAANTK